MKQSTADSRSEYFNLETEIVSISLREDSDKRSVWVDLAKAAARRFASRIERFLRRSLGRLPFGHVSFLLASAAACCIRSARSPVVQGDLRDSRVQF
jgi:hypothetical protein